MTRTAPLQLGPELTIVHAAAHHDVLLTALSHGEAELVLDLGAVSEIDSAGVQLLVSTQRSLAERGAVLSLAAVSSPVREALGTLGAQSLIGTAQGAPR